MILEIDTNFLLDNKITAHQYLIVKLVSEKKTALLRKYIQYSNTLNDFNKDLAQLKLAGLITSIHRIDSIISYENIVVSSKFHKKFSWDSDPFEEFFVTFPIKTIRTDGTSDYLRVDKERCRKLYHNIVRMGTSLHEHIIKCLKLEIEDRELKGKMSYMKRMPAWLTSESWKAYEDHIEDDMNSTLEEKRKAYGTNIE